MRAAALLVAWAAQSHALVAPRFAATRTEVRGLFGLCPNPRACASPALGRRGRCVVNASEEATL
eukprot:scaffold140_cov247-Pinguiococcus_pyrenoidosus.AAC.29